MRWQSICSWGGGNENAALSPAPHNKDAGISLKVRESIDAYAADHKRMIADFMEKLTLEINKDIDRYKEEMISEMTDAPKSCEKNRNLHEYLDAAAQGECLPDDIDGKAIEAVRGCLSGLEVQSPGQTQMSMEAREAILSIRTVEWMKELEKHAVKHRLAPEILNDIEECKKRITAENVSWSDINSAVEELVDCIGHELMPDSGENDEGMKAVSIQVLKLQIQKITEKCRAENETVEESVMEHENASLKKTYGNMQKISSVRTSLAEIKNENLYLEFFMDIKKEHDREAVFLLRELLNKVAQNYDMILDEMKKVFQSIGEYLPGKENEKFYDQYEERKDHLDKEMFDKAETLEFGGSEIASFGYKTRDMVKSIVKKWKKKRKMLTMVPILMLIFSFLFEAVLVQEQVGSVIDNAAANDFIIRFGDMIRDAIPWGGVSDFIYSIVAFVFMLFTNLRSIFIFTVVMIIAFYAVYLKLLKLWCNSQMGRQCEDYLKIELAQFRHHNTIMLHIENTIRKTIEEYEREIQAALEHIFSAIERGSADGGATDVNWFIDLKEQWNKILG